MNQFWREFIDQFGGEYSAREHFNHLCVELLEYHSPGKQIINANKIDKLDSFHDLLLVYLPKLFTETLNVSRKSQIRKAFNKTINAVKKHNLKIYKWILCTTHTLNNDELKWWNQWKYKNEEQHRIDIELLDGDKIIQLLKKYSLLDKWTKTPKTSQPSDIKSDIEKNTPEVSTGEISSESANKTVNSQPLTGKTQGQTKEEPTDQIKNLETDKDQPTLNEQATSTEESETSINKQSDNKKAQITVDHKNSQKTTEPATEEPLQQPTHPSEAGTLSQKPKDVKQDKTEQEQEQTEKQKKTEPKRYFEKKATFTKVISHLEKLDEQGKKIFKKLREISPINLEKFKEGIDIDQALNEKIIDLYFKAKNAQVEKQYDKALFYYEILLAREGEVEEKLKAKLPEIKRAVKQLEKQIDYEQNIILGDIYLAQRDKLRASEFYEDALKDNPQSQEAKIKYNETLGDMMLESGLYKEALKAYDEALKTLKRKQTEHYKLLEKKHKLAQTLNTFSNIKYLPFLPDIYLLKAKHIEEKYLKDNKLVNKAEYSHLNKSLIWLTVIFGIFVSTYLFKMTYKSDKTYNTPIIYKGIPSYTAYTLYNAAMKRGDYFMAKFNKYGYMRVHVLDSAKRAYYRAAFYSQYKNEAVEKYKKAKNIFKTYIADAQRKIKQNPSQYLRIIGQPREGLQFFEFLLNPSAPYYGKYGYMDSKRNIVIPPIFDYDHHKHTKPGWEDFHNGKAVACLVLSTGDTTYFLINRLGKRVSKIYRVKTKK